MLENVIQIKSGTVINADVRAKKHNICEKDYNCNTSTYSCKNVEYLASITNNSVIIFDEIIDADVEAK